MSEITDGFIFFLKPCLHYIYQVLQRAVSNAVRTSKLSLIATVSVLLLPAMMTYLEWGFGFKVLT